MNPSGKTGNLLSRLHFERHLGTSVVSKGTLGYTVFRPRLSRTMAELQTGQRLTGGWSWGTWDEWVSNNMAARGRGRGKISAPAAPLRKPGEVPKDVGGRENTFDELASALKEFSLKPSDSLLQEVSAKFELYSTSDQNIQRVVDWLWQRALEDGEFAKPIAHIANKLTSLGDTGAKFRGLFLKKTQECYKTREATREKSVEEWVSLAAFLCQTFDVMRISDAPLKPLAGATAEILSELLTRDGRTDSEVDCFNQQFRTVGRTLQSVDEVSNREVLPSFFVFQLFSFRVIR